MCASVDSGKSPENFRVGVDALGCDAGLRAIQVGQPPPHTMASVKELSEDASHFPFTHRFDAHVVLVVHGAPSASAGVHFFEVVSQ